MKKKLRTKLKVDDQVIVISGKDKGKIGKVLSIHSNTTSIVIEGVNIVKKALKKTRENQAGGMRDQEAPIHISNVMYYHAPSKRGVRIGYKRDENGKKERIFKIRQHAKKEDAQAVKTAQ
ncbi:50S ribosomal protein L24 [Spirochaetota bacterium]|nr:50S ribosomal protein L24 [Spirochaetota bacterium]